MSDRRLAAKRREAARLAAEKNVPVRQTARDLGVTPSAVREYRRDRPASTRTPMPRALLLQAGWSFLLRFGELPTADMWNATKARERGAESWRCFREGWGPVEGGPWRSWPQAQDVTATFGSWSEFHVELVRERRLHDRPYVPRPVPPARKSRAALEAFCRDQYPKGAKTQVPPQLLLSSPQISLCEGQQPPVVDTPDGPIGIPGALERGTTAVVGVAGTGRSSVLERLVATDLYEGAASVVVVERADKPSIGGVLRQSLDFDMAELVRSGESVVVRSNEPFTRAMAVYMAADAAITTGRHVSLIVDDGDDVISELLGLLCRKLRTLHITVAWTPKYNALHGGVWFMATTRFLARLDPDVAQPFWRTIEWEALAAELDGRLLSDMMATTIQRR